ncbi:MAG: tyrosine-type recombinase/integrase [Aristaeellaceae bacterium]
MTDWFAQYLELYKRGCKPRTLEEYRRLYAAHVAPVLGAVDVTDVTPEDIQRVLVSAQERSGARTAQAVHALLRALYRRAVRSRLVIWSPVDAVDRPQHTATPGIAMTEEDYRAALPWIMDDLGLSLALLAGLRRGEIAGLQWADVDLSRKLLTIKRTRQRVSGELVTGSTKSAAGARCVPISPELLPILRGAYRLAPQSWVCPCAPEAHDRRWQRMQRELLTLSQHYRLHDLRHTYVTRLLIAGAKPRIVQYVAGHSSLDITMRVYTHITPADAQRELSAVYIRARETAHLTLNQGVPGSSP